MLSPAYYLLPTTYGSFLRGEWQGGIQAMDAPDADKSNPLRSSAVRAPRGLLFRIFKAKSAKDEIRLRASALSYTTLASLVPIFAIILAVLSGPSFQKSRDKVLDQLAEVFIPSDDDWGVDPEAEPWQQEFKDSFRSQIEVLAKKQGTVSVFGFIVLALTVVLLFQAAERSLNAVWRAHSTRSLFMRAAIATSLMFWGPVILAVSVSLSELLRSWLVFGTYFIPTLFSASLFTALYMVLPHTKVRLSAAFTGGLAAALGWEIAKLLFLLYVTHVVSYNRVYGSLGLIPMLFLWVYVSWLLILYGAELAYCVQHRRALVDEWHAHRQLHLLGNKEDSSAPAPQAVILAVAIEVARRFQSSTAGATRAGELAKALSIDPRLAQQAAQALVARGILSRVAAAETNGPEAREDPAFLPACETHNCAVSSLFAALSAEQDGTGSGPAVERARQLLAAVSAAGDNQLGKLSLADLANEEFKL